VSKGSDGIVARHLTNIARVLEILMLSPFRSTVAREAIAKLAALDRSQAIIEFGLDGTIITANANFLNALGYTLAEVQGKHHGMFVDPRYCESGEYKQFWERLARGQYMAAQFKRIGKGGREVWIEASYNPVLGRDGKPFKVVKYATDVTRQKMEFADLKGQVDAIGKSQAVISFALDGTVQAANDKFLAVLGYALEEIKGKHHSMFVEPAYRDSAEYRAFWAALNRGEYQAAQFKRLGKGGREVWIEASYNPILDLNGKPFKVVKYATDITAQIENLASLKQLIDRNFGEIDRAVDRTSGQAGFATSAVQTASGTVQTLAASAEELAASVREIANMMVQSKTATDAAADQAVSASRATERLVETSSAMGGIIAVIRNIAGQINLLALNATIESARAGEAGKGFAVVAGEVKSLARQAADATNKIATEIERLQVVSGEVVTALGTINKSIDAIREFAAGTASAVEEQSVVTQQMSSGMQTTANTVVAINDNMNEISAAVTQVAEALGNTRKAAKVLVR
jgi:methyl-accepting chemotaxis protein